MTDTKVRNNTLATIKVPRYQRIASDLRSEILSGRVSVGDELPTEGELSRSYGVSRSTAREALRCLQQEGLIARKRGAASRVVASESTYQYSVALSSEEDVFRYEKDALRSTGSTILQLQPEKRAVPKKKHLELSLPDDEQWYAASGVRWGSPSAPPIAAISVYVPAKYRDAVAALRGPITGALFTRMCVDYGLTLSSIEHTITAVPLPPAMAIELDADPGSAALRIVRRYSAAETGLFVVSVTVHPADRFGYTVRFERSLPSPNSDGRATG